MKAVGIKIFHYSKWGLLVCLICMAILSVAGRVLLLNVEHFKNDIEQELAGYGIRGVKLENIEGHWQGLQPYLKIKGGSLSIPGRSNALSVNELSLRVKLIPSLLSGTLILESLHSRIEKLILTRDVEGAWWLNDIPLMQQSSDKPGLSVYGFFQRLPSFVNIDIDLIQLRDLRNEVDYLIQNTALRKSQKKQQVSVELSAQLPHSLGRNVQLILKGDAFNQQLYVNAEKLDIARVFKLATIQKNPLEKGLLSLQGWVDLDRFQFKQIVTQANFSQLLFTKSHNKQINQQPALNFSLQQKTEVDSKHWRTNAKFKNIQRGTQKFADISSQLLISKEGDKPQLWIDRINLSFLRSILLDGFADESVTGLLTNIQPDGMIENIVAELDIVDPMQSIFGFNFNRLHSLAYRSIPGLTGIQGSLISARGTTRLNIDSQQVSMDFGDLFRTPLSFKTLKANALVQLNGSAMYVDADRFSVANPDLAISGRLRLELPETGLPFMSLRANYRDGDVTAVSTYLPVRIMHENVVNWIDKSIRGGHLTQGDFLFHGRLEKPSTLNKNQSGVMHASMSVSNPVVKFLPDWPELEQGEGSLDFINTSMHANFLKVKFADTIVDKVDVKIPDFLAAKLLINTHSSSTASDLLGTLSRLPVTPVFNRVKQQNPAVSGMISSEVRLEIPLSKKLKKKIRLRAKADLDRVAVSIPDWMVDFTRLTGAVMVDNDRVSAPALSGRYAGDKVKLSVISQVKSKQTRFQLTGSVHTQHLLSLVPPYLQQPVSGVSPWDITVSVAHQAEGNVPLLDITAHSSLLGTELSFPQPARLLQKEKQDFKFNAELYSAGLFNFELTLKDRIAARGRLNLSKDSSRKLDLLNVQLGSGRVKQEPHGISIAGRIKQLNVNDWIDYHSRYFSDDDPSSPGFMQQINSVDLDIDQLIVGKQQGFNNHIKIDNNGRLLSGNIRSSLAKGSFRLPYTMSVIHPFVAELDYIKLSKSVSEQKLQASIRDMPNLFIRSKTIAYDDMEFNDLTLSTRSEDKLFVIEQLDFSKDKVQLKSSGHWQYEPQSGEHVSVFNIDVKGDDFGQTVNNLGLGETIKNGRVEFNGQIGWGGELYSINWPTLIGEVELNLEDGYLKNVDPGAGRFVGLLSFNALPKRLFLDFGDVVKEGMQFNSIRGKFNIKGELLETDNASMDSVSARVNIKGTTNLRHKTYDQTMTIIPRIGDTLPVIGALTAGNAVGWGILLLQKIFQKPIDKSVEIEYKVTGSWEKPAVDLITRPKIEREVDGFNETEFNSNN